MKQVWKNKNGKINLILLFGVIFIIIVLLVILLMSSKRKNEKLSFNIKNSDEIMTTENVVKTGKDIYDSATSAIEETESELSKQEKRAFNAVFEVYKGENVKGTQVKSLSQMVKNNNEDSNEHQIEFVAVNIVATETYTVTFSYDKDGYVNKIEVK